MSEKQFEEERAIKEEFGRVNNGISNMALCIEDEKRSKDCSMSGAESGSNECTKGTILLEIESIKFFR